MSGSSADKQDSVIRFAVGSLDAAYSAVWNLAMNGNDVYLFGRQPWADAFSRTATAYGLLFAALHLNHLRRRMLKS